MKRKRKNKKYEKIKIKKNYFLKNKKIKNLKIQKKTKKIKNEQNIFFLRKRKKTKPSRSHSALQVSYLSLSTSPDREGWKGPCSVALRASQTSVCRELTGRVTFNAVIVRCCVESECTHGYRPETAKRATQQRMRKSCSDCRSSQFTSHTRVRLSLPPAAG